MRSAGGQCNIKNCPRKHRADYATEEEFELDMANEALSQALSLLNNQFVSTLLGTKYDSPRPRLLTSLAAKPENKEAIRRLGVLSEAFSPKNAGHQVRFAERQPEVEEDFFFVNDGDQESAQALALYERDSA